VYWNLLHPFARRCLLQRVELAQGHEEHAKLLEAVKEQSDDLSLASRSSLSRPEAESLHAELHRCVVEIQSKVR
jgi:hypothetical protein